MVGDGQIWPDQNHLITTKKSVPQLVNGYGIVVKLPEKQITAWNENTRRSEGQQSD